MVCGVVHGVWCGCESYPANCSRNEHSQLLECVHFSSYHGSVDTLTYLQVFGLAVSNMGFMPDTSVRHLK